MRQEFLDVMLRGKSKIWSNDTSVAPSVKVSKKEKVLVKKADEPVVVSEAAKRSSDTEKSKKKKVVAPTDDVDDLEYFKSRVKKNLSDSDSDSETGSDEDEDEADDDDDGEADADGDDGDTRIFPLDGDDDEAGGAENDGDDDAMEVEDGKMAQDSKVDSDDVLQTGRLFVRNLPYTATYWIVLFTFCFIFIILLFVSDCCSIIS